MSEAAAPAQREPRILRVGGPIEQGKPSADEAPGLRRTDPKSFLPMAAGGLKALWAPIAYFVFTDTFGLGALATIAASLAVFGLLAAAIAYLQWYRLTYRVGEDDIRVESGIIVRQARSVPFDRIQDVSLQQPPLPRLFGLVAVTFETGAGGKDEITLQYLDAAEGERLREVVRSRRDTGPMLDKGDAVSVTQTPVRLLFAMGPRRVLTFGVFEFSLAVVAAVFAGAQQLDWLLPFDIYDIDAWRERLAGPGAWLAGMGTVAKLVGAIAAIASLLAVGFATGLIRTSLREWGFALHRTDKGLRRRRGLLTKTDVVMPVHRVQALNLSTGVLRRLFGWHGLRLISLGQDSGNANHVAAPFATLDEIAPIIAETGFDDPGTVVDWHRGSRRYRLDSLLVSVVGIGLAMAGFAGMVMSGVLDPVFGRGVWLIEALLVALAAGFIARALLAWDRRVHALTPGHLFVRHGVLSPETAIADREKLQSVEIAQGPLAARRGYATLRLGLAGGALVIPGLALTEARAVRSALLESMAARDFSRLDQACGSRRSPHSGCAANLAAT